MKKKYGLTMSIAFAILLVGFVLGYFVKSAQSLVLTPETKRDSTFTITDSDIERAEKMTLYCNIDAVESDLREYIRFYFPTTSVVANSLEIKEMETCVYHVRVMLKKGEYDKKVVIFEHRYSEDFSKYLLKTLKEENY